MMGSQQNQFLEQTLTLLRESLSTEAQTQKEVQKKLSEWGQLPEFNYSLMCILADPSSCDENTRSISCIVLKNNIKRFYHTFPNELKDFIKQRCLDLLEDPSSVIRITVGVLITNVAGQGELWTWKELLLKIGTLIGSANPDIVESTFKTLYQMCDELYLQFERDDMAETLEAMLPKFIEFFKHPNPKVRNYALMSINQFVSTQSKAAMKIIDKYLEGLFTLANDQDKDVIQNVCRSFVSLYDTSPEILATQIHTVIQYMMARSQDVDEEIALEACEFWISLPDSDYGRMSLRQHLPELIPFLLEKMRHSPEDIEMMRAEIEDDFMVPDKDDDIKPRFYRAKMQGDTGVEEKQASRADADGDETISDLGDGDPGIDDDDEEVDSGSSWNIRKCTAAALDCLSHSYGDEILPFVFQELQKTLNHSDWDVREASILAIGAVAEGSLSGMIPHLQSLVPHLAERMSDPHPMVRSISCWTISRYTFWIIQNPEERHFAHVNAGLLKCILDNNKRVQEAACSAFATIAEGAGITLLPYLDQILTTLVQAFDKYQHKNLLNLYDAVGTLAEAVKSNLNQPKYIEILMPPIINKWNSIGDNEAGLFPLLECLSSIAVALNEGFRPHAEPVFRRCLTLVEQNLKQSMAHNIDPDNNDEPNKDFMIAGLDLMSGLAEGLKGEIKCLIASSNVVELTLQCMHDPLPEVRQSSFALLGDLTKACFEFIHPHVPQIMPVLAQNLKYEHPSVCNNATWAVGEMAMIMRADMRQYVPMVLGQLLSNINQSDIPRTLLDNTAISIGRLSFACPDDIAPLLKEFIKPWCASVRVIRDNDAKDSAFRGVCELIRKNPGGVVNDFYHFCDAVACWDEPKPDLKQLFYEILHGFKTQVGEERWQQFTQAFPDAMKQKLSSQYGV